MTCSTCRDIIDTAPLWRLCPECREIKLALNRAKKARRQMTTAQHGERSRRALEFLRRSAAWRRAEKARVRELETLLRKHAALACSECHGTGCYLGDEDRNGPCGACAGTGAVLPADVVVAIGGGGR